MTNLVNDKYIKDVLGKSVTRATDENLVGYTPSHDIYQGMEEALGWYADDIEK